MMLFGLLFDIIGFGISGAFIEPGHEPYVVAIVTFDNRLGNTELDQTTRALSIETESFGPLNIPVEYVFNTGIGGADTIIVTPPNGLICSPASCQIEVQENSKGRVELREFVGM